MTPHEMIGSAIEVAEEGLLCGELPIGAVVVMGEDIVGRAFTQEKAQKRRLVHADLLAMAQADESLGWRPRPHPLRLAVNLEPCLMCLGAAMTLGVAEVYFGLESPADGAASVAAGWTPVSADIPSYAAPLMVGGVRRSDVRNQFSRYCETAPDSGLRRWARTLAQLPAVAPS
ncbi:nucleoside deaminase [Actinopolymorpha sp. B11F2]